MFRKEDRIFFTDQDKNNVHIRRYTDKELNDKERIFQKNRNHRRVYFLIVILAAIALACVSQRIRYPLYLLLIFMLFITILYEYIDRVNLKAIHRKYYIEVEIVEKLEPEVFMEQTMSPGSKATTFYSIKGTDSTTKYESIFYVDKNQYDANIGDKIRISVKGEKL